MHSLALALGVPRVVAIGLVERLIHFSLDLYRSHVSKTKRLLVFTRDRWACQICQTTSDLTIDHVKPVALGGSGAIENLQTLCRPCNSRKKDRYALGVSA